MDKRVNDVFYSHINDIRDPITFLFSGFLLGIEKPYLWIIGACILLLYAIFYRKNKLIYAVFWEAHHLKILFFLNTVVGFIIGHSQTILSENHPGALIIFIMAVTYVDALCFKRIIKNYIKANMVKDEIKATSET